MGMALRSAVFRYRLKQSKWRLSLERCIADPDFDVKVCVTAQHRQMLDQVLDLFDIRPDFDLDLMKPCRDLSDISSSVAPRVRTVSSSGGRVLVHGDTTTSVAAALSACYAKVSVAHVEAGLRTFNKFAPLAGGRQPSYFRRTFQS